MDIIYKNFSDLDPKSLNSFELNQNLISKLKRLKILNIRDLLTYKPTKYITRKINPSNLIDGDQVILTIKVINIKTISSKLHIVTVLTVKNESKIELIFFRKESLKIIKPGGLYTVEGVLSQSQISHPGFIFKFSNVYLNLLKEILGCTSDRLEQELYPIYNLTYGLINQALRELILKILFWLKNNLPIMKDLDRAMLPNFWQSLFNLHAPLNLNIISNSIYRLGLDEILSHKILLHNTSLQNQTSKFISKSNLQSSILQELNLVMTEGQSKVLAEIETDQFDTNKKMNRLLQGDVGSGKTLVSLLTALNVICKSGNVKVENNSYQVAILVPLEILAKQHYKTFSILEKFGFKVTILTSSTKNKSKIFKELKEGKIDVLIGTQAILHSKVEFNNLLYVIVDEQQRFGVAQRNELIKKGAIDLLMLSATPIPRTMQIAYYGNMDISTMRGKIQGRSDIITSLLFKAQLPDLMNRIHANLVENTKIYWICGLKSKEDPDSSNITSVQERFDYISNYLSIHKEISKNKNHDVKVHKLTSDTKANEREEIFESFCSDGSQILVATTVIEVGIDVPSASIIVIEDSQQFGLSQLHQLRGRVGRGNKQSYCILLYNPYMTSKEAKTRLNILKNSTDGFWIAEEDLKLRGSGDVIGTKQSGATALYFFNPNWLLENNNEKNEKSKELNSYIATMSSSVTLNQIQNDLEVYFRYKNTENGIFYQFITKFFIKNDILSEENDLVLN